MLVLRGTQKLLKELRLKKSDLSESGDGALGSWFVNLFWIERRKCVLITNDQTLYSVLLFGLTKPDFDTLDTRFRDGLIANLRRDGFPPEQIASLAMALNPSVWSVTNSRSVLGSMNDMILTAKYLVAIKRRETEDEIRNLNIDLNRTPMSALKRFDAVSEMAVALEDWKP